MPVASRTPYAPELGVLGLVAPGDERREPAGLVLQLAQPEQVLEPLLERLDRAVHHRRRRAQAGVMRVAHHVRAIRRPSPCRSSAAACGRDRRGSRRRRPECCRARGDQPRDHLGHRQLRQARDVDDLRRRQRVQLEGGVPRLDGAEQVFVPLRAAGPGCARPAAAAARRRRQSSRRSSGRSRRSRGRSRRPSRPAGRTRRSCSARRRRSCS